MVVDLGFREGLDQVFRAMEAHAAWVALARQLEKEIAAHSDVTRQTHAAWQQAGTLSRLAAEHGVVLDRDKLGRWLLGTIDAGLAFLRLLDDWLRAVEAHGQNVRGAAEVREMIAEQERIRSEAMDNWPWTPTRAEWDEAIQEFEQGESVDIDDAFAAAAGLSREEWARRVDERRRQRRDEGGGQ